MLLLMLLLLLLGVCLTLRSVDAVVVVVVVVVVVGGMSRCWEYDCCPLYSSSQQCTSPCEENIEKNIYIFCHCSFLLFPSILLFVLFLIDTFFSYKDKLMKKNLSEK